MGFIPFSYEINWVLLIISFCFVFLFHHIIIYFYLLFFIYSKSQILKEECFKMLYHKNEHCFVSYLLLLCT